MITREIKRPDTEVLDISPDVKWIGILDYDIVTFDVVMTTGYGTTYNSYFINAEKKAIIETSKETFWQVYLEKIKKVTNPAEIEFIVLNHTEPDHSGNLGRLLEVAPNATVVASRIGIEYLKDQLGKPFKHIIAKDGDILNLGNKNLRFIAAPNLHWPDSMYTYLEEEKLLFTCDSFGSHFAHPKMYDNQVGNFDEAFKYYFDVILKPFSKFMLKAIEKIRTLEISAILTGHGPLLLHDWKRWVDISEQYARKAVDTPQKNYVFIPYVSAYKNTGKMAEAIAEGIRSAGDFSVEVSDIEHMPLGDIDERITRCQGLVVGCPTINQNILLPIYKMFAVMTPIRDKGKVAGSFGSYGWSGEATKLINSMLTNLRLQVVDQGVFFKFTPHDNEFRQGFEYGKAIGERIVASIPD